MEPNENLPGQEYRIRYKWYTWAFRVTLCITIMFGLLRGSRDDLFDPDMIGLYTGGLLICVFILLSGFIGRARKITISDHIIIKRFLLNDYCVSLDKPILLDESAILFENYAVELNGIKAGDLLEALESNPSITLDRLKPEDSENVARLGLHRIRRVLPFVICALYAVVASIFHITLLPGSWDFTAVPLVVFIIWYLAHWWPTIFPHPML